MKYTHRSFAIASAFTLAVATGWVYGQTVRASAPAPGSRTVIHSQSELPVRSYKLTTPTASALLDDESALRVLAEAQRKDAEATLTKFEITDKATLRDLYAAIRDAALIRGDAKATLANSSKIRELAEKPSEKLTSGLLQDAVAAAMGGGDATQQRGIAFKKALAASVVPLQWAVVREDVMVWKAQLATPNTGSIARAGLQASLDPVVNESGRIGWDAARSVIRVAIYVRRIEPYKVQATDVLGEYVATHKKAKVDIWDNRKVTLESDGNHNLTPVVLAIWDEGVDTTLFLGRLYTNSAENADGKDDDGNGFIDDINGIGFDEADNPATESLAPFNTKFQGREAELRELRIGRADSSHGIDSAAAKAYEDRLASLTPEQLQPLLQAVALYGFYAHGTHVAVIAMDANPAARLMVIRSNSPDYKPKPPAYTPERAKQWATHVHLIVDYMKAHGVRVVNMSWGEDLAYIESTLEANGIGKTADERRKIALEAFHIDSDALTEAFRNAPNTLFVPGAGNSNTDAGFDRFIPADIDLPNVLSVGAVDQAGDEASFTSYGERVRVYANGFQVESVVPGGSHMRDSGTSAAAPQVTNLAAKLFALNPKLTPTDVIKLILDGATKSADGKRFLINPKASVALLEAKR